ncbi:aminoglycoside adenylyltransferase family protein [Brachybacterium hainanense]|uniref:Aminoglycoside adenylyltransferase family protein n=1 Tax=Brachybacterium hainanense TaxID=1541174 RepID=A0ABV6RD47_9MICO
MDEGAIAEVLEHLDRYDPGGVLGVYLYGSAVAGGLRPGSDIDLLVVTRRSLDAEERADLVAVLLEISGWGGHGAHHPTATRRRPVELTSVVAEDVDPWRDPPREDLQFGEWLRDELSSGRPAPVREDPDLVVLAATALQAHQVLRGPALRELIAPLRPGQLETAMVGCLPGLLADLHGDERNVLLTLARILVTLETGRIVPKDRAAHSVASRLPPAEAELLEEARRAYLDGNAGRLGHRRDAVAALAERLARTARTTARGTAEEA